jgi:hypothetical protein
MIKLTNLELHAFFPGLVNKIQDNHNVQPIAEELFVKRKPVRGLCQIRNYFLEIEDDIFLQYTMEHVVVEPSLFLIARTLREVILYSDKDEFELARIADIATNGDTKQNFELN